MRYDAVAFLESLFRSPAGLGPEPAPAKVPGIAPDDLTPEWHFLWDERAAVMEYDGKMPKERAEALALADILGQMKRARESCENHTCN